MKRSGYLLAVGVGVLAIGVDSFLHVTPKLIWNASASVPIGLYLLVPARALRHSELVAARPPEALAEFFARRGYLPLGVPLMKHIAGLPGQRVCRIGVTITVDGAVLGKALARDSRGRPLPVWQGCRRLAAGQVFLMNPTVPDSLDGRYFGPLPARSILGRAIPLLTDAHGTGHLEWRLPARERNRNPNRRTLPMPLIGQFTRRGTRYIGHIRTLTLDREVVLVPAERSDAENAPDYRVHCGAEGGPEIGAGWKRSGEKAGDYLSLQIDDPSFVRPIRANLFQLDADKDSWVLQWNRPPRRSDQG